jgi:putative phage-type endonuclease
MEQRSVEWFEIRKGRVTASLVGAILGLSPYMTRADAMRSMVREALGAEREFQGNVATEYGTMHEDQALLDFRIETGLGLEKIGFVASEDWAGCSPDAYTGDGAMIEVKCPYGLRHEPAPVPFKALAEQPHYYAQVQFQLWVTGKKACHFWQWSRHGHSHEIVEIDPDWRDENLPKLRQFHAEYLHEVQNNAAEHLAPKRAEIDTPEARRMVREWDELLETIANLDQRKKDLLAEMVSMADGKNATFGGRKLTKVERQGSISYAKAVKDLLPGADLEPYRGKASSFWQVV